MQLTRITNSNSSTRFRSTSASTVGKFKVSAATYTAIGVGFRYFTQRKAQELKLSGWVRNIPDNKVDGEAQGDEKDVETLLKLLNDGPRHALVVKLEKEHRDVVENESGFEVRR
ncbi:hypothetical protein jhhlp_002349 [Lomentospora prolificans]|uniref:acylphosphatase n=1 Tax=Lomentospora prolificans TaxID=41688 RepID=A0A2N3NDR5_9PEZI|nr:hypothetical protein jhhlp_002349 [Lomentospora prolificans]